MFLTMTAQTLNVIKMYDINNKYNVNIHTVEEGSTLNGLKTL